MTKFSAELAVSICDFLCGCSVVKRCCEAHGITESTFWLWVAKSKATPSEMPSFTWMQMDFQFFEGVQAARRLFANGLLDSALQRARYGSNRRILYQGEEKFAVRTDIPPDITDPDVLEMLFDQRDRFKRDANGHLVHLTEAVDPPVALTLAVLASQFEIFQPHSSQSIEVINKNEMGVLHVGGQPKAEPIKIEHVPTEPILQPEEVIQRTTDLPRGEDLPVEAPIDRSPAYVPPEGSRKYPDNPVKAFAPEAMADDPPEIIGDTADAAPADPLIVRAPPPDVMMNPQVREAKRRIHDGLPARGPVEKQLFNALLFTSLNEQQRIRRLQELTGSFIDAESRSEKTGAGGPPSGQKGFRVA
jgi:hypothetical protein